MAAKLHFLDWNMPITAKTAEFLLAPMIRADKHNVDLENTIIIVPTRQAGRHLHETMVSYCAEHDTALLSVRTEEPGFFFRAGEITADEPSPVMLKMLWAEVLNSINPVDYPNFFPAPGKEQDFSWAIRMGEMIQRLRATLADGGYLISTVVNSGITFEETERWSDMAELEKLYQEQLNKMGLTDPCIAKISRADHPELPEGITRIVMAAVPDPSLLTIRALKQLAATIDIDILVHAPESMANSFDEWGRPMPEKWPDMKIDISDANIVLAGSPREQSRHVIEEIAKDSRTLGPADIAICVPDGNRTIVPYLKADLAEHGLPAFDPADKALKDHPACRLIESFCDFAISRTYKAFGTFLRHPDILCYLESAMDLSNSALLTEFDEYQNEHLPSSFDEIMLNSNIRNNRFPNLIKAADFIIEQLSLFDKNTIVDSIRSFCQTIYSVRTINTNEPDDNEFQSAVERINTVLEEFAAIPDCREKLDRKSMLILFKRRLYEQKYHRNRDDTAIDLEGWLELPWNSAKLFIITGMNEGIVPASRTGDVFLPDSMRSKLGLRDNAGRFARDIFLTRGFLESHKKNGRVCFIVGKTSGTGDPLKPSRILFRCNDADLPARADKLFSPIIENWFAPPSTITFKLDPQAPDDVPANLLTPNTISVTKFRDYLMCPFRFYLKHILKMDPFDSEKSSMDALEFGSMVHAALKAMADTPEMARSENETELAAFLGSHAEEWVNKKLGTTPSLPAIIALNAAKQRLRGVAHRQVELTRNGWEIIQSEQKFSAELNGMKINGIIDRIDRHQDSGIIRIIDYKTSDKSNTPEKQHLENCRPDTRDFTKISVNSKVKRWADLQLPLYVFLFQQKEARHKSVVPAYFNLPKAVSDTSLDIWEEFTDALLESAVACAENVIAGIREQRFWPPAERVSYDDFENLFINDYRKTINEMR